MRHEVLRHVAVDPRAHAHAGDDVGRDLEHDLAHMLPALGEARVPAQRALLVADGGNVEHPGLDQVHRVHAADHQPGDDGHSEPQAEVDGGDLPAEHAKQQRQRHLVDHGRRHQKREGHAQRHTGGEKTDEQRHRRARAKRRDDAQAGRQHIAHALTFAREDGAGFLRGEKGLNDAHQKDDERQQHQHLGHFKGEKTHRAVEVAGSGQAGGGRQPAHEGVGGGL